MNEGVSASVRPAMRQTRRPNASSTTQRGWSRLLALAAVAIRPSALRPASSIRPEPRAQSPLPVVSPRGAPIYLGLSATTISVTNAARIAARVKELAPGVVTIVGGPRVSAIPERTLEAFPSLDYGIAGEGGRTCGASGRTRYAQRTSMATGATRSSLPVILGYAK